PQQITAGIVFCRHLIGRHGWWLLLVPLHQMYFPSNSRPMTLAVFPDWGLANHRQRGYTTSAVVRRD
ncbi:MAG: hypothetical protein ACPGZS_05455, partial [Candidatus Puniceispirillaceae bacterium]